MKFSTYQREAKRTERDDVTGKELLVNASLGLSGEAGEFADLVKKHLYQGHELDTKKLVSELGDILWYINLACSYLGIKLNDVPRYNIDKLRQRYPDKFDANQSINRVEEDVDL